MLKLKYRVGKNYQTYPARPRTGNSHGPAKTGRKVGKINHRSGRIMRVDGATGKSRFEWETQ
jgi:hypothetical protein